MEAATLGRLPFPGCSVVFVQQESIVVLLIVARSTVDVASVAAAIEAEMAAGQLDIAEFERITSSLLDDVMEKNLYLTKIAVRHEGADFFNDGGAPGLWDDVLEPDPGPVASACADASSSATEASLVVREELHLECDLAVRQVVGRGGRIRRDWSMVLGGKRHCRVEAGRVLTDEYNQY